MLNTYLCSINKASLNYLVTCYAGAGSCDDDIVNYQFDILEIKLFIPSRHIHSIIKHLVYYTTLGIVKINIFEHFKKYLNSTNIFLETDNNFTQ